MFGLVKTYFTIFFVFSFLYLLLLQTPLFASVKVLFYRGVLLLLFSFLCFVAGYFILRKKFGLREETFLAALVMSLSLHLAFFVVFPVTFERSITMFFLKELSSQTTYSGLCGGLTSKQAEESLIKDYIIGKGAVARRVEEQRIIGFVDNGNECIQITGKGRSFLEFAKMVNRIYGIEE